MELADVLDSKSSGGDTVPVRPRSPAPKLEVRVARILTKRRKPDGCRVSFFVMVNRDKP